jgi:hypothetical protein
VVVEDERGHLTVVDDLDFAVEALGGGWQIVLGDPAGQWAVAERDGVTVHDGGESYLGRCYSLRVVSPDPGDVRRWFRDAASLRSGPPPVVPRFDEPQLPAGTEEASCTAEFNLAEDRISILALGSDSDGSFVLGVTEDNWSLAAIRAAKGLAGVRSGSRFVVQLPSGDQDIDSWILRGPDGRTHSCVPQGPGRGMTERFNTDNNNCEHYLTHSRTTLPGDE